jgi:wobble nucleotide-excising tRNase
MINRIRIQDLATFTQPVDICPKDINFMYGGNGTGKTTISKLISGEIGNAFSTVEGLDPATETTLVYNKTFVDATFQENKEIPGIFTLGLEAGEAQEYVRLMEEKCVAFSDEIKAKEGTIKNFLQEKEKSQAAFTDVCWQTQVEYGKMFPKAMIGTRAAKDAFRDKCLDAYNELHSKDDTSNGSHVHSQDELKILYDRVFAEDAVTLDEYPLLDAVEATQVDTLDILSKPITGKADSDIGRFIDYLGSSDWAKHGEELSKRSEGKCPYCARILPVNIRKDIEAYFDDTYKNELGELRTYIDSYARISQSTINRLDTILANPYANFQYDEIAAKAELYKARVEKNLGLLGKKAETPSVSVELTACADLVTHINDLLEILNNEIAENNNRVADIKTAKAECQTAVWRFFAKALSESARVYLKQSSGNAKAIEKVTAKRNNLEEQRTLTNGQKTQVSVPSVPRRSIKSDSINKTSGSESLPINISASFSGPSLQSR